MRGQVVGHDSLNIAACGHQLEKFDSKRHFLPAHFHARAPAPFRRFERVRDLIARFFRYAHAAVTFQGREQGPAGPVDVLEVGAARVPAIKQQRAGLDGAFGHHVVEQGQEMVVSRLLGVLGGTDPIIEGQQAAGRPVAVHQINQADAENHTLYRARALAPSHVDEFTVAFILPAIVDEQERFGGEPSSSGRTSSRN